MPGFEKRKTKTADLDKFTPETARKTRVPKKTQGNTRHHAKSRLLWQMILRWSVLRRAIRTLHRRQNVPASWENIELSHIHTYTHAGCWLTFLDCSQSNASQWLWRPVWFLQSPGTTFRRVLPVYAFCLNWVQIADSKVVRPHAIHRNSLFCSGRIFVQKLTGWCCFQHEDLQN